MPLVYRATHVKHKAMMMSQNSVIDVVNTVELVLIRLFLMEHPTLMLRLSSGRL